MLVLWYQFSPKNIHYEMFCSCSITSWKISWFELEKLKLDKNQVYKKYCLRILTAAQYPIKVIWNYKAHSFWSVQILNSLTEHFRQLEIKPIRSRHRRCSRKFRKFHRKTPGWSIFIKSRLRHKCFLVNIANFLG